MILPIWLYAINSSSVVSFSLQIVIRYTILTFSAQRSFNTKLHMLSFGKYRYTKLFYQIKTVLNIAYINTLVSSPEDKLAMLW